MNPHESHSHTHHPEHHPAPAVTATGAEEWTCPMHPEVRQPGPGACPICGMALEPRSGPAALERSELKDMTRRFWTATLLSAPLVASVMAEMWPGMPLHRLIKPDWMPWIGLGLATPRNANHHEARREPVAIDPAR